MKQFFKAFTLVALLFVSVQLSAQKALAKDAPITYLGIDFTGVKVINDVAATPADLKSKYFPGINQLIINEPKKFEWAKALETGNITNDLSIVTARNENVDEKSLLSTNTADETHIKEDDIRKWVSQYKFDGKKGTGLIVFMESMSKTSENGSMWVTFVDMGTKKVLLTERMSGKAQGFSFRNYYSYPIFKVIQDIKKHKIDSWRAKI